MKIAIVSHCILNQNSVVKSLRRVKGSFKEVVSLLIKNDFGIIQLPCPELIYLGINREGRVKEEYDTEEYRELCRELLKNIFKYIREYEKDGYKFLLIGIEGSPTCGIFKTETKDGLREGRGILMEELLKYVNIKHKIEIPVGINNYKDFLKELERIISSMDE
ncbi:CD3072 family TudS-related putative desulfidase [Methanocaldococcus infernus]